MREELYLAGGISREVFQKGEAVLAELSGRFEEIDRIAEANQLKVLQAMQKNHVAADYLNGTTGYGYNDAGRDTPIHFTRRMHLYVLRSPAEHTH